MQGLMPKLRVFVSQACRVSGADSAAGLRVVRFVGFARERGLMPDVPEHGGLFALRAA